jgi:hypothetical protein
MRHLTIDAEHAVRSADLASRWDTVVRGLEHTSDGRSALALADDVDKLLEGSTDAAALRHWRLASGLLPIPYRATYQVMTMDSRKVFVG